MSFVHLGGPFGRQLFFKKNEKSVLRTLFFFFIFLTRRKEIEKLVDIAKRNILLSCSAESGALAIFHLDFTIYKPRGANPKAPDSSFLHVFQQKALFLGAHKFPDLPTPQLAPQPDRPRQNELEKS